MDCRIGSSIAAFRSVLRRQDLPSLPFLFAMSLRLLRYFPFKVE
jgi:hypothetical protein